MIYFKQNVRNPQSITLTLMIHKNLYDIIQLCLHLVINCVHNYVLMCGTLPKKRPYKSLSNQLLVSRKPSRNQISLIKTPAATSNINLMKHNLYTKLCAAIKGNGKTPSICVSI